LNVKFPVKARLYNVPPAGTPNPIDYVKASIAIDSTIAQYYVLPTPPSLADSSYLLHMNNPGDTIDWHSWLNSITNNPRVFPNLPPIEKGATPPADKYTQIGMFYFEDVPEGDYVLALSRAGYVTRYAQIHITKLGLAVGHKELILGDINDDEEVTASDVDAIHSKASTWSNSGYDSRYDLNSDGKIDATDAAAAKSFIGFKAIFYTDTKKWVDNY